MDWMQNKWVVYGLIPLLILVIAWVISKVLRYLLNLYFIKSSAFLKVDKTRFNFVKNAVSFIVFMTAFFIVFYRIPQLKAIGVTLFAGAGIFAAVLAFASQQAFSNIISGIFLVIFKPIRVGDHVRIGELHYGVVEDITLRHTIIRNYENRRIIIPNSTISDETITNSSIMDERICSFMELGISYDTDINKAIALIQDEVGKHPDYLDNRTENDIKEGKAKVRVRVIGWGDSSINLRAYIWAKDSETAFSTRSDLFHYIKDRFDKEGIEIPFPYRTVVFKNKPQL